jgi:iron(III) transport system permease protein
VLIAAGAVGLLAVLGGGFAIGLQGWSFEVLQAVFGPLPRGQIGIGLGGALTLLALIVLLAAGVARLGRFRGDFFIAGSAPPCAALLLLFVALPVARSLLGALQDEAGRWSASALVERLAHERVWGLSCPGWRRALRRGLEHALPGAAHGRGHDRAGHAHRAHGRAATGGCSAR